MKYTIGVPEFNPITVTFENQQEVTWLMGLITTSVICEAIRNINPEADIFFDDLYNALRTEDNNMKSSEFGDQLGERLGG